MPLVCMVTQNRGVLSSNWIDGFYDLSCYLSSLPEGKKVVFLERIAMDGWSKIKFSASI